VRATGYPLYLLLGYFWSRLPIGDVGYRMNLFSAFNGALTVLLADRILRRWRIAPWATFGALGLLACATFFWALSLIAEVYTLHTALMAALILLLLRWGDDPIPRRLALVGFVMGASLGHAATVLLSLAACRVSRGSSQGSNLGTAWRQVPLRPERLSRVAVALRRLSRFNRWIL
jgi:hypothetical protein